MQCASAPIRELSARTRPTGSEPRSCEGCDEEHASKTELRCGQQKNTTPYAVYGEKVGRKISSAQIRGAETSPKWWKTHHSARISGKIQRLPGFGRILVDFIVLDMPSTNTPPRYAGLRWSPGPRTRGQGALSSTLSTDSESRARNKRAPRAQPLVKECARKKNQRQSSGSARKRSCRMPLAIFVKETLPKFG